MRYGQGNSNSAFVLSKHFFVQAYERGKEIGKAEGRAKGEKDGFNEVRHNLYSQSLISTLKKFESEYELRSRIDDFHTFVLTFDRRENSLETIGLDLLICQT